MHPFIKIMNAFRKATLEKVKLGIFKFAIARILHPINPAVLLQLPWIVIEFITRSLIILRGVFFPIKLWPLGVEFVARGRTHFSPFGDGRLIRDSELHYGRPSNDFHRCNSPPAHWFNLHSFVINVSRIAPRERARRTGKGALNAAFFRDLSTSRKSSRALHFAPAGCTGNFSAHIDAIDIGRGERSKCDRRSEAFSKSIRRTVLKLLYRDEFLLLLWGHQI